MSDFTGGLREKGLYRLRADYPFVSVYDTENPRQAVSFCTIMDYLGMALTGQKEALVHTSNAAGFGLFDVQNGCFYEDILEQMGVGNAMLPKITGELSILGTYKEIPVCTAIGDNQASFLGSV